MKKKCNTRLVTKIIGSRIFTSQGEDMGTVQNIVVYPESGAIIYIVLCFANFIGKCNRYFAIPSQVLTSNSGDDRSLILDENFEVLLSAPILTRDKWPLPRWSRNDHHVYALSEMEL